MERTESIVLQGKPMGTWGDLRIQGSFKWYNLEEELMQLLGQEVKITIEWKVPVTKSTFKY